jgi:AmmeMemoRadiSam system protein A
MQPVLTPTATHPTGGSTPSVSLSAHTRGALLELARVALGVATGRAQASALGRALERAPIDPTLGGVFVTLTTDGDLRGCMGNLGPDQPLREAVLSSALSAALDDPRFLPVAADELPEIRVEISVLGRPVRMTDPAAFQPGLDGVIVERGGRRGLLLPEVATDWSWGSVQMFDAVCRKAGLPADAWRDPGTRLLSFRTARFGGPAIAMH